MKKIGNISEHADERADDLLDVYFSYLHACKYVSMPIVFASIVDMPAKRFWVSSSRATVVVSAIIHGDKLDYMRPNKREMFMEIYRRYLKLRRNDAVSSVARLVQKVVSQPAPKFYISASSAKIIILKARKEWFKKDLRKRRHSF